MYSSVPRTFSFSLPLLFSALLHLLPLALPAQTLTVVLDSTRFPEMSAGIYLFDSGGEMVKGLRASDIVIHEDGILRSSVSLECDEPKAPPRLSTVVTVDISGSMREYSPRLALAKAAAAEFISRYPLGRSECAVTSFDDAAYFNRDFTIRRDWLLEAVDELYTQGGTDYNAAMLQEGAGALRAMNAAKYKPVVLLLTDGAEEGNAASIVAAARKMNAVIYCVAFEAPASPILRSIVGQTGGMVFDRVETAQRGAEAMQIILDDLQGHVPCRMRWQSDAGCSVQRRVTFDAPAFAASASATYHLPPHTLTGLKLLPAGYAFGSVAPGESRELEVEIRALNAPVTILGLASDDPRFLIVDGGPSLPKRVAPDEALKFKVRFAPTDSNLVYGRILISSDLCAGRALPMSGGIFQRPVERPTLRLVTPNGGEAFAAGDTLPIRWEGVLASDTIALDYSIDAGKSWRNISMDATGLEYRWIVPNLPSDRCLLSARQFPRGKGAGGTLLRNLLGAVRLTAATYRADGKRIAGGDEKGTIRIWDTETGTVLRAMGRYSWIKDIQYSPDGGRIVVSYGNDTPSGANVAQVFDTESGQTLMTLSGYGSTVSSASFSPDGERIMTVSGGAFHIWNASTGGSIYTVSPPSGVDGAWYSPDGRHIITGGAEAGLWDAATGAFIQVLAPGFGGRMVPSYDGKMLAVGNPPVIVDAATGDSIAAIRHYSQRSFRFSRDGALLVTATDAARELFAEVWDTRTGMYMGNCHGVSWGTTMSVEFSPDDRFLMTARADTVKIWSGDFRVLQSDLSDSLWRIVAVATSGLDVDMGRVMVMQRKDTLVRSCVRNGSSMPITVRSVSITGAWAGVFTVVAGRGPYTLEPGEAREIEFRFAPTGLGRYNATIEIRTQGDTVMSKIAGEGVARGLLVEPAEIRLGEHPLGARRETSAVLKNIGTEPITVTGVELKGSDSRQFTVADIALPVVLLPGAEHTLHISFTASRVGRTETRVVIEQDATSVPFTLRVFASVYGESLDLPDTSAAPGERIVLPVLLRTPGRFEESIPYRRYRFQLRYDAAVLYPVSGVAGPPAREGVYGIVTVEGTWDGSDTLARPGFVAALGTPETFDLDLLSFTWLDESGNPVDRYVDVSQGAFHLVDLCVVGGERMILAGEQAALKPAQPNPASGVVFIPYQVAEHGRTRLILHDMLGRMVTVLVDEDRAPGAYVSVFDISSLASGTYLCTLQTPTERFSQVLQVMR